MFPSRFDYSAPDSFDEALATLGQRTDETKVLAGGQSLIPLLKLRFAAPTTLVDINRIRDLQEIALSILAEMVAKRHEVEAARPEEFCEPAAAPAQAIDPICGMSVAIVEGVITASHDGETFYFCAPGCRKAFLEDPAGTLERASAG